MNTQTAFADIIAGVFMVQAAVACDTNVPPFKGKTIAECHATFEKFSAMDKYSDCSGVTNWEAVRSANEADCKKGVMNTLLDKRLLKLKADHSSSAQAEFKMEMKLQKFFLDGVEAHCQATYGQCQGTMYLPFRAGCPGDRYALRASQAEMINNGRLEFPEPSQDFAKIKSQIPAPYVDYAKLVCQLPASVWKDGKAPSSCEDRVLSSLKFVPNDC